MRSFLVAGLILAAAPLRADMAPTPASTAAPAALPPGDPLGTTNVFFRQAYAKLRADTLAKTGPVVLQAGDDIVLLKNGVRLVSPAATVRYHELKAVDHVALAAYVMAEDALGVQFDAARSAEWRSFRDQVAAARASIPGRGFSPKQKERQLRILDGALAFLDAALASGKVSQDQARAFARAQAADSLANARDAAVEQVEAMERVLKPWLDAMTPAERAAVRVVVGGSHMPRVGNASFQYLTWRVEGKPAGRMGVEHGDRVVFAEATFDETKALNLLGTHIVDGKMAEDFFADADRMHRDLLADGTEDYLREKAKSSAP